MLALLHATYPGTAVKKVIEAYMSPELPKRPSFAKEVASFVYNDLHGYHTLLLLDVEDARLGEWHLNQGDRNIFMESRVEGLRTETRLGLSVMDAIARGSAQLPR
jgi:hypothetical protein